MLREIATVVVTLLGLLAAPAGAATAAGDGWRGDPDVLPSAYSWLDDDDPDGDYHVVMVRGLSPAQVRRTLGTVERRTRDLTPAQAERWTARHRQGFEAPRLAVIARRGRGVLVYSPYWILPDTVLARLSRAGTVVDYTTTVEYDTYLTVSRHGKKVRRFDAFFRPPRAGALPEEQGLDWGARDQNVHATAWAFMERVTRIHVDQAWFEEAHPSYVFRGSAF